jgi:hypothetical protein
MKWLKDKAIWIVGCIIALYTIYLTGRKDGKNESSQELLKVHRKSKRVNDMSFTELVDRMHEYNDK